MRLGETIENAIRQLVDYCHRGDVRCENCPFVSKDNKCDLNMGILEDLVHFTDAEIIPQKEDVESCASCEYCRTDYAGFVETGGMMRLAKVGEPVCTFGKDVYDGEVVALGDTKRLCEKYTERKCEVGE